MLWHIRNTLTEAGYTPVATWDPEEVERLIAMGRPHLVLLSGHGANQERDLALAFESGADDYIARPFSPTESWSPGWGQGWRR